MFTICSNSNHFSMLRNFLKIAYLYNIVCVKAINFKEANFLEIPQVIANFHLLLLKIANIVNTYSRGEGNT